MAIETPTLSDEALSALTAYAFPGNVRELKNIIERALRGVTDLVGSGGGEAYEGNIHIFVEGATEVLRRLVHSLPAWIAKAL